MFTLQSLSKSILYFSFILFVSLTFISCTDNNPASPDESDVNFEYGNERNYDVADSKDSEIRDTTSGMIFKFPAGSSGILTIFDIVNKPDGVPDEGKGFKIEFSGDEDYIILIPRSDDIEPFIWYFSEELYSNSDGGKLEYLWQPIMPTDTTSNPAKFSILPYTDIASLESQKINQIQVKRHSKPVKIWNSMIKKSGYIWERRLVLEELTKQMIINDVSYMSSSLQTSAKKTIDGRLKLGVYSAMVSNHSYYHPWVYFTDVTDATKILDPYICYNIPNATANTVAHEVGHYISHVILGDEKFGILASQAVREHDCGFVHNSRKMLEEYAFWSEYLNFGGLNDNAVVDIENPNVVLRTLKSNAKPSAYDFPSLEGFGCALMVRMVSTKNQINSHDIDAFGDSDIEEIPTLGLKPSEIFDILSSNQVVSGNELYAGLNTKLTGEQNARFRVAAEKIGWSYNTTVLVLDSAKNKIENALVKNVIDVNKSESWQIESKSKTNKDGICTMHRIYPGKSKFRVLFNFDSKTNTYLDSMDFDYAADYTEPTNKSLPQCTLKIKSSDLMIESVVLANGFIGDTKIAYAFKALFKGTLPPDYRCVWDFGEDSSVYVNNDVTVNYKFKRAGIKNIHLRIYNRDTYEDIAETDTTAKIGFLASLKGAQVVVVQFKGLMNLKINGENENMQFQCEADNNRVGLQLNWSGNSFSADAHIGTEPDAGFEYQVKISGSCTEDGLTINNFSFNFEKKVYGMNGQNRFLSSHTVLKTALKKVDYWFNNTTIGLYHVSDDKLKTNLTTAEYFEKKYFANGDLIEDVSFVNFDYSNEYFPPEIIVAFSLP